MSEIIRQSGVWIALVAAGFVIILYVARNKRPPRP